MVGYYVHARLQDYLSHDIVTSYRKIPYENNSVQFPNIAICNRNTFFLNDYSPKNKFDSGMNRLKTQFGFSRRKRESEISSLNQFLMDTGINTFNDDGTKIANFLYDDINDDWLEKLKSDSEYSSKRSEFHTEEEIEKFDKGINDWVSKINESIIESYKNYYSHDFLQIGFDMINLVSPNVYVEEVDDNGTSTDYRFSDYAENIKSEHNYDYSSEYLELAETELGRQKRSILKYTSDPNKLNKTVSALLDRMGWSLSSTSVFSTRFRKQALPSSFFKQVQTEIGNCALFESNPVITQKMAGSGNGLEVFINIEHEYYTSNSQFDHDMIIDSSAEAGVSVFIYDSNSEYVDMRKPINVSPGTLASIGITETQFEYMEKPYGDCDSAVKQDKSYSLYNCMQTCYIDSIIAECHCRPHFVYDSDYSSIRECNYQDYLACQYRISQVKQRTKLPEQCGCLQPCYGNEFDPEISYTAFPSDHMTPDKFKVKFPHVYFNLKYATETGEFNQEWKQDTFLKNNLLGLNIYFKDLKKIQVKETEADKMPSLIADLGGTFGLWLGMSIVTIVEILYCMIMCVPKTFIHFFCKKKF